MSELQKENHPFLDFVSKNKKVLTYTVTAIAVALVAFFGYAELYQKPREEKAADAMFTAEKYFAMDSSSLVLNGDGQSKGVLYIIKEFGGTKAANLAKYYAGISYLNLGDYENALSHLSKFSGSDEIVSSMALGAMGDAHSELGNLDKGISFYKKAANNSKNEYTGAMFLMKAAAAYESKGEAKSAKGLYEQVKKNYPDNNQTRDIDKYIARAEANL